MHKNKSQFAPGLYRPVYLWAGPGTVRMNRLKFMGAAVDEAVHQEAHTEAGASRVAREAGFNWAYLMYDWGFPPEVEQEDWKAFRQAVGVYQAEGVRVSGYIQASNCVYAGSFRQKDWYAQDPRGRPFYYYTGRLMTCWTHPEWLTHLEDMVRGVLEAGADGVFFDNPWHACQPLHMGGTWLGPAGCYCPRCRRAFREESKLEIPPLLTPETDPASRAYLRWRAGQVTRTLERLAQKARRLSPGVVVSANNFDAVMRPSLRIYGIDLVALARIQDVLMIEDYGLPRWKPGLPHPPNASRSSRTKDLPVLVNNALTIRTATALAGNTPLSTDPYDRGIGFDAVYPSRRFQQGIAEAAACGASMVVKGTEFLEGGKFTLLTAEKYTAERRAIGQYHRWLEAHSELFLERRNAAQIGLRYPGEILWQDWDRLAPLFFGVSQTLLAAQIPWRVILPEEKDEPLEVLFTFEPGRPTGTDGGQLPKVIHVPDLPGWAPPPASFLARHPRLSQVVGTLVGEAFQAYFRWQVARRLADMLDLAQAYTQSSLFRLPPQAARTVLLAALGNPPAPSVLAPAPVLAEIWAQPDGKKQLHLVNYAGKPQTVRVSFGRPVKGCSLSPDSPSIEFQGDSMNLNLDIYTVCQYA